MFGTVSDSQTDLQAKLLAKLKIDEKSANVFALVSELESLLPYGTAKEKELFSALSSQLDFDNLEESVGNLRELRGILLTRKEVHDKPTDGISGLLERLKSRAFSTLESPIQSVFTIDNFNILTVLVGFGLPLLVFFSLWGQDVGDFWKYMLNEGSTNATLREAQLLYKTVEPEALERLRVTSEARTKSLENEIYVEYGKAVLAVQDWLQKWKLKGFKIQNFNETEADLNQLRQAWKDFTKDPAREKLIERQSAELSSFVAKLDGPLSDAQARYDSSLKESGNLTIYLEAARWAKSSNYDDKILDDVPTALLVLVAIFATAGNFVNVFLRVRNNSLDGKLGRENSLTLFLLTIKSFVVSIILAEIIVLAFHTGTIGVYVNSKPLLPRESHVFAWLLLAFIVGVSDDIWRPLLRRLTQVVSNSFAIDEKTKPETAQATAPPKVQVFGGNSPP